MARNSTQWIGVLVALTIGAGMSASALALGAFKEQSSPIGSGLLWLGVPAVALLLGLRWPARPWACAIALVACIPVANLVQVTRDGAKDPTSHNLWPVEILLVFVFVACLAVVATWGGVALAGRWRARPCS